MDARSGRLTWDDHDTPPSDVYRVLRLAFVQNAELLAAERRYTVYTVKNVWNGYASSSTVIPPNRVEVVGDE
ncbi:hypothetical protein AAF712_010863 [Marasmius tenuissimus]|uniref:Lectin n=1 Tax=Marasmius tenuissimus TaxID=585030 RepID=A0ABR2ZMT7_9AGAR|nr:hypothetical protein PM082_009252 [Marasmius tenuissimus]